MNEQTSRMAFDLAGISIGDVGALEGLVAAAARPAMGDPGALALTEAYRRWGHLRAALDPLGRAKLPDVPALAPASSGLEETAASDLVAYLERAYCGSIGWEFGHIADDAIRTWFAAEAEAAPVDLGPAAAADVLRLLTRAHAFETSLSRRIPGGKLFGLGGAESFVVLLDRLIAESAAHGVDEVVVGGMHRGRFNLMANVAGKPLADLVAEVLGKPPIPDGLGLSADVSYHLGWSGDRDFDARTVHLSISPHPSHLQLVPIIAQGRARAKQRARGADGSAHVLPLLLHTDASFSGQGLVAEMFQLSRVPPFDLGGTVHVVIDNQIGFTTLPEEGRSARRPTDIARLVEAPVLHVNADDPEAVVRVAQVAARFRAAFRRDIVIDLVCYRRPGHNEIDEPRFTQPEMYAAIDARPPVHDHYAKSLTVRGMATEAVVASEAAAMDQAMAEAFATAKSWRVNRADWFEGAWSGLGAGTVADMLAPVATGLTADRLRALGHLITTPPDGFAVDEKVRRSLAERRQSIDGGEGIGWATGEALALASLLSEGVPVRFGGQDTLRGAFTQRHWMLHDQTNGARHLVLSPAAQDPRQIEIHNTPLIEHAVLCFEYGVSLADPHRLVVWEAQFGEFLNIAQPVFDQAIACGEDRWLRSSGLVILLPHGLDGGGPDHSTGRPERLLAACAGANLQIVNASTPANFFHVLRRQMARAFRKPLVVLTPKALLRHKGCVSPLADFEDGTSFRLVIAEPVAFARRIILCTGKAYYELAAARAARGLDQSVALVRIEQLHPLPAKEIAVALAFRQTNDIVWCEEEPANMGYFGHLDRPLERIVGRPVRRVGRPAVATPATGVKYWHEAEMRAVFDEAFAGL
jgi:2-oxoglutarate dehydrogenase E1 component